MKKIYTFLFILLLFVLSMLKAKAQDIKEEIRVIPRGTILGYKGVGSADWFTASDASNDWSGCYIGNVPDVAIGYIGQPKDANGDEVASGTTSLWVITLKKDVTVHSFSGSYISDPNISQDDKAAAIKKFLNIPSSEKLNPYFGRKGEIYEGPYGEEGNMNELELIVSWDMDNDFLEKEKLREYTVRDYDIKKYKRFENGVTDNVLHFYDLDQDRTALQEHRRVHRTHTKRH